jgi:hypothetical protein
MVQQAEANGIQVIRHHSPLVLRGSDVCTGGTADLLPAGYQWIDQLNRWIEGFRGLAPSGGGGLLVRPGSPHRETYIPALTVDGFIPRRLATP